VILRGRLLRAFNDAVGAFDPSPYEWPKPSSLQRLRLFLDAYELPAAQRSRVIDALVEAHEWCYRIVRGALSNGHEPFERTWRAGGDARAQRTRAWLLAHEGEMRNAVA